MSNVCWLGMGLFCLVIGVVVVGLALLVWVIVWLLKPSPAKYAGWSTERAAEPAEQVVEGEARPTAGVAEAPAELPEPAQEIVHEVVTPFEAVVNQPQLYSDYSRQEVHDIFAPETPFTPQAGTWGLHGIVRIPDRDGDFCFFVTFGQEQAEHVFKEWITEDGVLNWQSQPKQSLDDTRIQQFIHHDERRHHIYLFLRTRPDVDYTYLGELQYLWHDPKRERPVYFRWQILDWHIPATTLERMGLQLRAAR